jgi:uncharacterized protein (DUF2141 family)
MKKLAIALLFVSITVHATASTECESNALDLTISKIKKLQGQLFAELHSSDESFLRDEVESFRSVSVLVTNKGAQKLRFCAVPEGDYAISVFHDENSNRELDTGFLGIPKEPYGFSNNLKKMLPPSFEEATFHYTAGSPQEINLK